MFREIDWKEALKVLDEEIAIDCGLGPVGLGTVVRDQLDAKKLHQTFSEYREKLQKLALIRNKQIDTI